MDDGRIVERGTHSELFAARGRYHDLYTRQHGYEANLFLPDPEPQIEESVKPSAMATGSIQDVMKR